MRQEMHMLKIAPLLPTVFAPTGTPSRVIAELLKRLDQRQPARVVPTKEPPRPASKDLPSAA